MARARVRSGTSRLPTRENVYVATGHFRNGTLLAPITGKLMSQLILKGRKEMPLESFSPTASARTRRGSPITQQ